MKPKEKKGQEAYICVFGAVREKLTMDGQSIQPREEVSTSYLRINDWWELSEAGVGLDA